MAAAIGTPRFRPVKRVPNKRWMNQRAVCGYVPTQREADLFSMDMYNYINQFFGAEAVHAALEKAFPRDWTFEQTTIENHPDWEDDTPHWVLEHKTEREVDPQDESQERPLRKDPAVESPYVKAKHGRRKRKDGKYKYSNRAPTMPVITQNKKVDENDTMCQMYATHHYMYPDEPLITQEDAKNYDEDTLSTTKLLKLASTAERIITSQNFQNVMNEIQPGKGYSTWDELVHTDGQGTFKEHINETTTRAFKITKGEFMQRQLNTIRIWKDWGYRFYQGAGDYGILQMDRRKSRKKKRKLDPTARKLTDEFNETLK